MEGHKKLVHRTWIPIRWGDMDAYGHVNNTIYFRYMEQARLEWLDAIGVAIDPQGKSPVIINASFTFLKPLIYPGRVDVRTYIGHIGRSSIPSYVEVRLEGSDVLYAEGAAKLVWTDMLTGRSVPVPDGVRALLEAA